MQTIVFLLMLPFLIVYAVIYSLTTAIGDFLRTVFNIPLLIAALGLGYFACVAFANHSPDPDHEFLTALERFGTLTVAGGPIWILLAALAGLALVGGLILRLYRSP
jgi:hypothetical protein